MHTIAIIGAGFSGTMVAVHLLRARPTAPLHVALIERSGRFTAGVAYGTRFDSHLLNVPAGRMSAFDSEPDHFLKWAKRRDPRITGGSFVPRMLYGEYLASTLDDAEDAASAMVQLSRVPGEAVAIRPGREGRRLLVELDRGGQLHADRAVLAIGNFPPADPAAPGAPRSAFANNPRCFRDPWAPGALDVAPDEPVMLVGTGLTMLDVAIALRDRGHRAVMHAVSRRGLLPQPHRVSATPPPHLDRPATIDSWPRTARGMLRAVRAEVRSAAASGVDWREVITSLRADTPALWTSLPHAERARFLRHLRPYWETHRHRAAPATADSVEALIAQGRLVPAAARVVSVAEAPSGVDVAIRRRAADANETIRVARVINCTGPDTNLARVSEPLVRSLRDAGLIRPDPLGLGLETDDRGALLDSAGRAQVSLSLVGPLRKAGLWENTAVPELRAEAQRLAQLLAASIHPGAAEVARSA